MKTWLAMGLLLSAATAAHPAMPVDALRSAVERAAPFETARASLDPRVNVPSCTTPLETEISNVRGRQATIRVGCAQPQWQLYVPVRAMGGDKVVVLKRSLAADTIIGSGDIEWVTREGSAAGYGAFDQLESVIGLHTRRALPAGRILGPADVRRPVAIRRGDQVAIEVQTAVVTIRMRGEALADGGVGQRISVRNVSSGKRLEAIVRSEGTVEVPR